jgi:hypothetical protein
MDKNVFRVYNKVKQGMCSGCDSGDCEVCLVSEILSDISDLNPESAEISGGCTYCWDEKRKKAKEIFYFDSANNMRSAEYCPACGRKY